MSPVIRLPDHVRLILVRHCAIHIAACRAAGTEVMTASHPQFVKHGKIAGENFEVACLATLAYSKLRQDNVTE